MQNLQELPRFADKLSYLYAEHAVVDRHEKAIAVHRADGSVAVPAASLAVLLLGPGTTITHAAVHTLAENNCQVLWCGEHGVRFYAQGLGGARHSRNLLRQAALVSNDVTRLQVVIRMYCLRFDEKIDEDLTLQQLRGKEGVRVRQAYAEASQKYNVPWEGRNYERSAWNAADPVNRALSAANACLYGLVHAAVLSGGYSPALGFIHCGKQLSFIYDIADLYKVDYTIPAAFAVAAENPPGLERQVRIRCRDRFRESRLMERILPDIAKVLDVPKEEQADDEFAADAARPGGLWQPQSPSFSDATPIGQVLRIRISPNQGTLKGQDHDCDGPGTSDAVAAG
ncbi:MAG: type I-E CRISPR-associated endonuclease Cas1 [Planctomycetes bacterium]|nr:type I-E CRISPR-associated endonuclease Cas1 [Planctomycetota bacterium]